MSVPLKILFLAFIFASTFCLRVTFERSYITYLNPVYLEYAFANVTRYSRRSERYGNLEFTPRYNIGNNITELRGNQYQKSFIEFHYRICDFLKNDQYIGSIAVKAGVKCPLIGHTKYSLLNLTTNLEDFPSEFPFEQGRIIFRFNRTSDSDPVAEGVLHLSFNNNNKGKKKIKG